MDYINIIFIIPFIILVIVLYFFISAGYKNDKDKDKQKTIMANKSKINKQKNIECTNIVMDYDEINLNYIKSNPLDIKLEKETEQKPINLNKIKKIPIVRTYMDLPGYKSYNLEDLNSMELKDNNYGLINYNELKQNEIFKQENSLILS